MLQGEGVFTPMSPWDLSVLYGAPGVSVGGLGVTLRSAPVRGPARSTRLRIPTCVPPSGELVSRASTTSVKIACEREDLGAALRRGYPEVARNVKCTPYGTCMRSYREGCVQGTGAMKQSKKFPQSHMNLSHV